MESFSVDKLAELLAKPLPTGPRKALELAYLLSTQMEEGRPLRFAFLLSDHVKFLPERRLQPIATGGEAIRRLCLASDPPENCWRIRHDESTGDLAITGLADFPSVADPAFPELYDETVIEVDNTASVAIRVGDARAKYAGCKHFVPNADTALPTLIPHSVAGAMAQHCFTTTGQDPNHRFVPFGQGAYTQLVGALYVAHRATLEATTLEVADAIVPSIVLIMLRRMRELRHGGCVILTDLPNPQSVPESVFAKSFALYPISESGHDSGYNWPFLAYVQALTHLRMATEHNVVLLDDLKEKPIEEVIHLLRDVHVTQFYRDAGRYSRLVAQLSVVDGIVVVSSLLEPMIFGGLASVPPTFTDVADKGARHRAAGYCATLLPGSVAITVSQDGAMTAYRKASANAPLEKVELLL